MSTRPLHSSILENLETNQLQASVPKFLVYIYTEDLRGVFGFLRETANWGI